MPHMLPAVDRLRPPALAAAPDMNPPDVDIRNIYVVVSARLSVD